MPLPTATPAIKPLDFFISDPVDESTEEFKNLVESVARYGILEPVLCVEDGEVLAGRHRIAAARKAGQKSAPCQVFPSTMIKTDRRTVTIMENAHQNHAPDHQMYGYCKELLSLNPTWNRQDLASHLAKSAAWVTMMMAADDLEPEPLKAFLEGKFGASIAYKISKAESQSEALAKRLKGATRKQIEDAGKDMGVIDLPLGEGFRFHLEGPGLTFDLAVKKVRAAIREMEAAAAASHTVDTFPTWLANKPAQKPRKARANGAADRSAE